MLPSQPLHADFAIKSTQVRGEEMTARQSDASIRNTFILYGEHNGLPFPVETLTSYLLRPHIG
jgi:hypothetical protein